MRSLLVAAGAAVLLVVLTGCDEPPPPVTPVPTPSVTAVFASDEEALAAAEDAYAAYLAVSDQASAGGWQNPDLLADHVTAGELEETRVTYEELAASGRHTQGSSTFESMTLQRYDDHDLVVYLCLDVSAVRLLDSDGQDVTPTNRPQRVPLEVGFVISSPAILRVNDSDVWDGAELCS